jgi:multidrug efflux pump subunit AcrA (membrane-fusion protein)
MKRWALVLAGLGFMTACHRASETPAEKPGSEGAGATPVHAVGVARATLPHLVTGPGRTVALVQQKVRAPFTGTLRELLVTDGDPVRRDQVVGRIVSRESEAALSGARQMRAEASTPREKEDAERAVALAEARLVRAPLLSAAEGVVLSHSASAGDRVSEDQEILVISAADSLVFQADITQSDLPLIHAGQGAELVVPGRPRSLAGLVHGTLAAAVASDLTVPVRIDLVPLPPRLPVGLFGTARITVGERRNVPVVPAAAVLRDDVTGVSRIASVSGEGRVHWVTVTTGLVEGERVEILSPELGAEERVIVSGQVGLPEGAPVDVQP